MAYGVALDIGTTTVSGTLVDLEKRAVKKRFSSLNSQISYGHDIISRINYVLRKRNGLKRLNRSIISSINFVLDNLVGDSAVDPDSIDSILAVGNAVMYHFIFSLAVDSFVNPPYRPQEKEGMERNARELGIKNLPKTRFRMLPNIDGFIGSDAIAVILATGLYKSHDPILAMDIGTNGEIMLGSLKGVSVASTAAGPAFEGWHISCGMRPVKGAIESAEDRDGNIRLGVVGNIEPKGISGSGLIDLMSILLKRGEIDSTGRLKNKKFVVYEDSKRITLDQRDIREVQLAKAAFSVGTKFLRARKEINISKVYITGTFGNCLNRNNARLIGLIPEDIKLEQVEFLKRGALLGAEMVLTDPGLEKDIDDILAKTEHLSLTEDKDFQAEFASAMHF